MIAKGEAEAAKKMILALAPHQDPNAVDAKGRPLKQAEQLMSHLRARAQVYVALKDWDKALADAEHICGLRARMDADMSERSEQLGKDEAFRDQIKAQMKD